MGADDDADVRQAAWACDVARQGHRGGARLRLPDPVPLRHRGRLQRRGGPARALQERRRREQPARLLVPQRPPGDLRRHQGQGEGLRGSPGGHPVGRQERQDLAGAGLGREGLHGVLREGHDLGGQGEDLLQVQGLQARGEGQDRDRGREDGGHLLGAAADPEGRRSGHLQGCSGRHQRRGAAAAQQGLRHPRPQAQAHGRRRKGIGGPRVGDLGAGRQRRLRRRRRSRRGRRRSGAGWWRSGLG